MSGGEKEKETEEIRQAFALTVKTLRKGRGLAQEALAHAAGVDRRYMGALERGQNTPTLDTIFKLLPQLNVDFVQFAAEFQSNLKKFRRKRLARTE